MLHGIDLTGMKAVCAHTLTRMHFDELRCVIACACPMCVCVCVGQRVTRLALIFQYNSFLVKVQERAHLFRHNVTTHTNTAEWTQ